MPNSEEILAANELLREQIGEFQTALVKIENRERDTRIISYVLAFALVVLGGFALNEKANRAADKAELNSNYLISGCQQGNEDRAGELELWRGILADSRDDPQNQTPAKKKILAEYDVKVAKTYAQRDCSKVKEGRIVKIDPATVGPPEDTSK